MPVQSRDSGTPVSPAPPGRAGQIPGSEANAPSPALPSPASPSWRRRPTSRAALLTGWGILVAMILLTVTLALVLATGPGGPPIKVGILRPVGGALADEGRRMVAAARLAIHQINAAGGLLGGRLLVPVVADIAPDPDGDQIARTAHRLIAEDGVSVLVGCGSSPCRKALRPVVEDQDSLLIYPQPSEGLETSPRILYAGAAPNQHILPAAVWALDTLGMRLALVGSDALFPRAANTMIRDHVRALGGVILSEDYRPAESTDFSVLARRIRALAPDAVLSTLTPLSTVAFLNALSEAGTEEPTAIPVVSLTLGTPDLSGLSVAVAGGLTLAGTYFQGLSSPENRAFLEALRSQEGAETRATATMEATFVGLRLWAQAVTRAGTSLAEPVREALARQSLVAPSGVVSVDPKSLYLWRTPRLGRVTRDGDVALIWEARRPVQPDPFPAFRSRLAWRTYVEELHHSWQGRWSAPGGPERTESYRLPEASDSIRAGDPSPSDPTAPADDTPARLPASPRIGSPSP